MSVETGSSTADAGGLGLNSLLKQVAAGEKDAETTKTG